MLQTFIASLYEISDNRNKVELNNPLTILNRRGFCYKKVPTESRKKQMLRFKHFCSLFETNGLKEFCLIIELELVYKLLVGDKSVSLYFIQENLRLKKEIINNISKYLGGCSVWSFLTIPGFQLQEQFLVIKL